VLFLPIQHSIEGYRAEQQWNLMQVSQEIFLMCFISCFFFLIQRYNKKSKLPNIFSLFFDVAGFVTVKTSNDHFGGRVQTIVPPPHPVQMSQRKKALANI
jgi:hypothetical protein